MASRDELEQEHVVKPRAGWLAAALLLAAPPAVAAEGSRQAAAKAAAPKSEPAAAAQAFWKEWAQKRAYRFLASRDERVLLLLPERRGRAEKALELVERALARFDELLPMPAPDPSAAAPPAGPAASPPAGRPAEKRPWEWGAADRALDTDAIVVGIFKDTKDYGAALDRLAEAFPYLSGWIESGKDDAGCILERPLFGACIDSIPGMEEWNPDNELVHRTAQLAMLRRFGQQPVWVALGVGWNVEFDVLRSIYCFPWRSGFVSVGEHGGWEGDLRRDFATRERQPLAAEELAAVRRGSFEAGDAAISWGMVRFLAQRHAAALPRLLLELHSLRERLGRVSTDGGKHWTLAADYELPASEQGGALARIVAPDVLEQASDWFRSGGKSKKTNGGKG